MLGERLCEDVYATPSSRALANTEVGAAEKFTKLNILPAFRRNAKPTQQLLKS